MKVRYSITSEDFAALQRFAETARSTAALRVRQWGWVVMALFACVVVALAAKDGVTIQWNSLGPYVVLAFWGVLLYLVIATWWTRRTFPQRAYEAAKKRHMTEDLWLEVLPDGLKHSTNSSTNSLGWQSVERIDEAYEHLFFLLDDNSGFVIPRRAFTDEAEYRGFGETARRYLAEGRATSGEG